MLRRLRCIGVRDAAEVEKQLEDPAEDQDVAGSLEALLNCAVIDPIREQFLLGEHLRPTDDCNCPTRQEQQRRPARRLPELLSSSG